MGLFAKYERKGFIYSGCNQIEFSLHEFKTVSDFMPPVNTTLALLSSPVNKLIPKGPILKETAWPIFLTNLQPEYLHGSMAHYYLT